MADTTDNFLVFDLETQRDADSVGGWKNLHEMRMSVGVVWDSARQKFYAYLEDKVDELIAHLLSGPRIIGFNHLNFDFPVLAGYGGKDEENRQNLLNRLTDAHNLDLMADMRERHGFRPSLESIARPTLAVGKSADGLMALRWYKQYTESGDDKYLLQIVKYCVRDVAVTRDVFLYGLNNSMVIFRTKTGEVRNLAVDWSPQATPRARVSQNLFDTPA